MAHETIIFYAKQTLAGVVGVGGVEYVRAGGYGPKKFWRLMLLTVALSCLLLWRAYALLENLVLAAMLTLMILLAS